MEKRQAVEFLEYLRQDRNLERTIYGDALNMAIEALKAQLSHEGATSELIDSVIKVLRSVQTTDRTDTGFVQNMTVRECIERVRELQTALNNQVNLCDSCTYTYPECPSKIDDVIFGNGIGNDNICACNKYQPTVQPVATDTNVGDTISRQATINAVNNAFDRETLLTGFVRSIAVRAIRDMPSVQPEAQEGHWIRTDCGLDVECKCSKCGYRDFVEPRDEYWFKRNYCPNCGARMKGERQK